MPSSVTFESSGAAPRMTSRPGPAPGASALATPGKLLIDVRASPRVPGMRVSLLAPQVGFAGRSRARRRLGRDLDDLGGETGREQDQDQVFPSLGRHIDGLHRGLEAFGPRCAESACRPGHRRTGRSPHRWPGPRWRRVRPEVSRSRHRGIRHRGIRHWGIRW